MGRKENYGAGKSIEYFLFYLDRNLGQIYRKDGFTKGTAMAFREFISRKTGLTVRNIR